MPEDWGGKTITHNISAKQKQGINELLELVLLVTDMKELKADDKGSAVGTIIESHIDKSQGPVATVLVQAGTLKIGDMFLVNNVPGKIKVLKDWQDNDVKEAIPAMPVKILGLKQLPSIGEIFEVITDKKEFKSKLKKRGSSNIVKTKTVEEDSDTKILNLIIKSDVLGSAEAIEEALDKIDIPDTKIKVL